MDTSYIGQLISGGFYLVVGIGLLRLARRTGEFPERLLGLYFLFTGLDYCIYTIPIAFGIDPAFQMAAASARICYAVAVVALMVFTRQVFRHGESWTGWLTGLVAVGMFGGVAGSVAVGQWDGGNADSLWFWSYYLGYTGACIWVAGEAGLAFAAARKRQRIGLCDPLVANRYLLWVGFGAFQVLSCAALFVVEGSAASSMSRGLDALIGALELTSIAVVWLAFFPPELYRNWISDITHAATA